MIIDRAFYRETGKTALAIALVLLVMFVFLSLTVLLGRTARGEQQDSIILSLLAFQAMKRLDLLLPLSLYLGILLTLSRWYRDSEMTVLAACGVGLPQLLRPVLTLASIVAAGVALLAFYLNPLATGWSEQARAEGARRPELSLIVPGVFTEGSAKGRVLYTERMNPETEAFEGVFMSSLDPARPGVVLARTGLPVTEASTGDKFLVLGQGSLYDGTPGQDGYRMVAFDRLTLRLETRKAVEVPVSISAMPTGQLRRESGPLINAEWHWRLARPVSVLVFALFALSLAYTDARRGRLSNLFAAVLVYFIYSNLLGLGQTLLRKDQLPAMVGLWWVHGLLALAAIYLFTRRARNRPLLPWLSFARSR